ncbi:flagellar brake protein [Halalkalibacillus halophilus]|uniref:flagellar brake protein n=1 Tax=Halalkalibacillus halophilus TaxID=392827 RepID=UPI000408F915|nr:flagellar brake domain-containing protein [Halalkalibacillus halophilus]
MLSVGTKLTIEAIQNGDVEDVYIAKVVDFNNKRIFIDYPIHQQTGKTGYFLDGFQLRISFVGKHGSIYLFDSEILGKKKRKIPTLMIPYPTKDELVKVQRREYVRVNTYLDVAVYPIDEVKPPLISRTIDLSGGGIAVKAKEIIYEPGDQIEILLVLPFQVNDYAYLSMKGEVIRYQDGRTNDVPYKLSLKFTGISDIAREKVIKYCFEQQLERRRKIKS